LSRTTKHAANACRSRDLSADLAKCESYGIRVCTKRAQALGHRLAAIRAPNDVILNAHCTGGSIHGGQQSRADGTRATDSPSRNVAKLLRDAFDTFAEGRASALQNAARFLRWRAKPLPDGTLHNVIRSPLRKLQNRAVRQFCFNHGMMFP
jgi:hypothetical protein